MKISLAEAKQFLRINNSDEDNLIDDLICFSEFYIKKNIGYKEKELPKELKIPTLMCLAFFYDNRELSSLPSNIEKILQSLKSNFRI